MRLINRHKNYATQWQPNYDQGAFRHSIIKDQPQKDLYTIRPLPAQWWADPFKASIAIPAYINVGLKNGFGINDPSANNNKMPKWLDRASPLIWI